MLVMSVFYLHAGLLYVAETNKEVCNSKRWCTDCITDNSDCAWCNDKVQNSTKYTIVIK